ncbi:MAG: glycosyltransferase family 4 protein [Candidatus Magasanikbacteria bacterium]|nr:glycosyltransferase family 4 protein [Candidatus Magasanikbacteria bacterium]
MRRILIFSTAYLPLIGGAEVMVKEITDRLGTEFEFVLVTAQLRAELPSHERIGAVEVHRIGRGYWSDKLLLAFYGARYARSLGGFDAVWGIMASYGGLAALRYKKMHLRTKFLLTLQEGDSRAHIYARVWWWWPYFTQIFKRADKIQAISNYLAEWAREMGARCAVDVVPNGVDAAKFSPPDEVARARARAEVRQQYGISLNAPLVVSVSRLVPKNGIADLIQAMKFLPEDAHLMIVGEGVLSRSLHALVQTKGLKDRVHFVGFVSHNDLPRYLWASDIFCRPSLSEGLGNVFLEAMAAGVPVVAPQVGGIKDFLIDGETGLFCKIGDTLDIAQKIKLILVDKHLSEYLRKNGLQLVRDKFYWSNIARQMKNILCYLCV